MPRPFVFRRISEPPRFTCFKPRGVPMTELEIVRLGLDEFEAVRLADFEGLYHEAAAERMGISRQTFGNIIESARGKIADALVNSKALVMEGGRIEVIEREFVCLKCANTWTAPFGEQPPDVCPTCGSKVIRRNLSQVQDATDSACPGWGRRMRRCGRRGRGFAK